MKRTSGDRISFLPHFIFWLMLLHSRPPLLHSVAVTIGRGTLSGSHTWAKMPCFFTPRSLYCFWRKPPDPFPTLHENIEHRQPLTSCNVYLTIENRIALVCLTSKQDLRYCYTYPLMQTNYSFENWVMSFQWCWPLLEHPPRLIHTLLL